METAPPLFGLCAKVPVTRAQPILEGLLDRGAVDPYRGVTERGEHVLIPVDAPDKAREAVDAPIVHASVPPNPDRPPIARIRERLRGRVPDRAIAALPTGWTRLGDVALLRLPERLAEHGEAVGEAYGRTLDADAVLEHRGVDGPLREPDTVHLWGEPDTETVHREHGLAFRLDPARVLFSPGNHRERHRLVDQVEPGEHVVDLFAGVGYFTLPLARAGGRVTACELNPTSAAYLDDNRALNGLEDRIELREGDAREIAPSNAADRVVMGYLPGTEAFLPTAVDTLAEGTGRVHYHDTAPEPAPVEHALDRVREHEALEDSSLTLQAGRRVKTFAPNVAHVVLDLEVET